MEEVLKLLSDDIARRLDDEIRACLLGVDQPATTAIDVSPTPTLTWEQLIKTIEELERLKPSPIYYWAQGSIPKFDKDGNEFIMQVKLGGHDVFFFHPDWLSWLKTQSGHAAGLGETINTFTTIKIPGLLQIEEKLGETITGMIGRESIYQAYLRHVRGCGPLLSALVISLIGDPGRFFTISSLWAYAGLDVVDGKARRRKKGETSNWNHALRTAVVGMLVPQFIKLNGCFGRRLYDEYKAYYTERDGGTLPKIHIERRARRKVGKVFLACLWVAWRKVKGLPISNPYPIDKLSGHTHLVTPEDWMENGNGAPLAYTQEMDLGD